MMLSNLEYFHAEVMDHVIIPFAETAFKSTDELIASSTDQIKLVFVRFLKNAIESTRRLIRWLDGTCKESSPFHSEDKKLRAEFSYFLDLSLHPQIKDLSLKIISKFFIIVANTGSSGDIPSPNADASVARFVYFRGRNLRASFWVCSQQVLKKEIRHLLFGHTCAGLQTQPIFSLRNIENEEQQTLAKSASLEKFCIGLTCQKFSSNFAVFITPWVFCFSKLFVFNHRSQATSVSLAKTVRNLG
ncbi:hypothetical protein JTE90_000431 [Oedothorax gibbosus]|uniref:Uncharacterized protein n=1 Tax=Oedothorax gibbosus TaxID=931172 RepID=A0AAV6UF62_9ARAC|nr:hypothetical protein JTE90_000431 [Oedothorax gibbosus]